MITADIVSRTHFTRKVDGQSSFNQFLRTVGLQDAGLPFEFNGDTMIKGKYTHFIAESWGGFENASKEWTIFVSWRSTSGNITQYIHWTWDEANQRCIGRRNHCFVG